MEISLITTKKSYMDALDRLDELMDLERPTRQQRNDLKLLAMVIEEYENKHYKFETSDPVDLILFIMEQQNLTAKDMVPYFGSESKFYAVKNHRRGLSKTMIEKLCKQFHISSDLLMGIA